MPVEVLVDTGARGGNYTSSAFLRSVENGGGGGQSMFSPRGQALRVASSGQTHQQCNSLP